MEFERWLMKFLARAMVIYLMLSIDLMEKIVVQLFL